MPERTVLVPGARRVEATLESPAHDADVCVVASPPHPRRGGHRGDERLRAVAATLADRGIAVLRLDYGEWDEGRAEREDVRNALRWAADRYDRVGLVGYSFGGAMAALAAASVPIDLCAVALLAPTARSGVDGEVAGTLRAIDAPIQVVFGTRDTTAAWQPFSRAAESGGVTTERIEADHAFTGQVATAAATVGAFVAEHCGPRP